MSSSALGGPSITNGDFSLSSYPGNNQFGTGFGGQGVTGWTGNNGYNLWFVNGTATTTSANSQYDSGLGTGKEMLWGAPGFTGSSPHGYNFVAMDGDPAINGAGGGSVSQTINGLTIGTDYAISFEWAAGQLQSRSGATTEYMTVSLGNQKQNTATVSNPSKGFSGWFDVTFIFQATSTSQVLNFLSIGTPNGGPPIALLTDVAIQDVPEPASFAALGAGLLGLVAMRRRRMRAG